MAGYGDRRTFLGSGVGGSVSKYKEICRIIVIGQEIKFSDMIWRFKKQSDPDTPNLK
jgi:hypothetical protein